MQKYFNYMLVGLVIILLVLFGFLFSQYRTLRREQLLNMREFAFSQLLERHAPLAPTDADVIRSWMTFDYINRIFVLPANYLKNQLVITDASYPRITVGGYANEKKIDQATAVTNVQSLVRAYGSSQSATSTLPTSTQGVL